MKPFSTKNIMLFVHAVILLAISYLIALVLILSAKSLSFLPVFDESGDVPMSNIYLKINSKKEQTRLNTNITFVDIDLCKDRLEIAQLIEQIDALQPKVIGLDVFFRNRKEPEIDTILENVLRKCENLTIAAILDAEQRHDNDKYNRCHHNFFVAQKDDNFTEGFINLDSDGSSAVQTFTPKLFLQKETSLDTLYCFAVQIVRLYDETAYQKLLQRTKNFEIIHFQPFVFHTINKNEIADNGEYITDKIVLIGSLSEDRHKTPINTKMHGIEIHAQIISTIIEEKYIDRLDNIWTKLITALLCYLFSIFCCFATIKFKKGVGFLIKLAQVAFLLLVFFAGYYLFNRYSIDITYTRSMMVIGIMIMIVDVYYFGIAFGRKYMSKIKKRKKI